MREPRLSQPEYNYIFARAYSIYYDGETTNLENDVIEVLKSRKIGLPIALVNGWKYHCERNGLSPFVLHWLTKSEKSVEEFYQELIKNTYLDLFYCYTTHLPVMKSNIQYKWVMHRFGFRPPPIEEDTTKETAIKAFYRVHPLYLAAKENGSLNDEYMRKFNGSTISKADWTYLKGIVGIYD